MSSRTDDVLADARRCFDRSTSRYELAQRIVSRERERLAQIRLALQTHRERVTTRALQAIIRRKLDEGHLPNVRVARIYGAPGTGILCCACERMMNSSQLIMSVPWPQRKTFAQMHADCFLVWHRESGERGTSR